MNTSKKIFLAIAIVFFVIVAYIMYDMSSRTTSPWQEKNKKVQTIESDSVQVDTVNTQID